MIITCGCCCVKRWASPHAIMRLLCDECWEECADNEERLPEQCKIFDRVEEEEEEKQERQNKRRQEKEAIRLIEEEKQRKEIEHLIKLLEL